MGVLDTIISFFPEVEAPKEKKLAFKTRLKWTLIILGLFFLLGEISLFGLAEQSFHQFEYLSQILGANFGSLTTLGIGPIVTASIILQLLQGAGILKFDLHSPEGKRKFQGVNKLASLFFVLFEAIVYVFMGGLAPMTTFGGVALSAGIISQLKLLIVLQLFIGGILILFMDDTLNKWGIGSGISLFIAAGVAKSLFIRSLSPMKAALGTGVEGYVGAIPEMIRALTLGAEGFQIFILKLAAVLATLAIFGIVVYVQSMRVEIPLSFARIRGHGMRWPLNFLYTSNIPVILVAALLANIQLWAQMAEKWSGGAFTSQALLGWVRAPGGSDGLLGLLIRSNFQIDWIIYVQALVYILILAGGSVLFSFFWVQTGSLDAASQAKNIMESGLSVPGFRKDPRVLERMLARYIGPLTIMGGISIGLLAGLADLLGALANGTGILLAVMIVYKMYQDVAREYMYEFNPTVRKFMGKR